MYSLTTAGYVFPVGVCTHCRYLECSYLHLYTLKIVKVFLSSVSLFLCQCKAHYITVPIGSKTDQRHCTAYPWRLFMTDYLDYITRIGNCSREFANKTTLFTKTLYENPEAPKDMINLHTPSIQSPGYFF